jgi:hypothetical protein
LNRDLKGALSREIHETMHGSSVRPLSAQSGSWFNSTKGREQLTIGVLRVIARELSLNVEAIRRGRNGSVDQVGQGSANWHGLGGRDVGNYIKVFHYWMVSTKPQYCRK